MVTVCRVQQGVQHKSFCDNQSTDSTENDNDGYYNINTHDPSRFKKTDKNDATKDILNSHLDSHFLKNLVTVKEQKSSVKIIDEKIGENINNVDSIHRNGMTLPPVVLPRCAILKKGYQRASVICQYNTGLIDDETDQFIFSQDLDINTSGNDKSSKEINDELNRTRIKDTKISYVNKGDNKNGGANDPVIDSSLGSSSVPLQLSVYEVVIHSGEAFLKQKRFSINSSGTLKNPKIINFSTGWQHTILHLEN